LQREQENVIAFLREENRVLKAQLEGKRLRLDDSERWRLRSRARGSTRACLRARPFGRRAVGSSTTTRGESRDDARAEPSLAARHGAPRACHRGDSHTYSTRSTV